MSMEKRQAVRLSCDLPVRLHGEEDPLDARMVDISRLGMRVRIAGADLRVHRLSSLAQISRRLTEALGEGFEAELHPEVLGPLLRKGLVTTRIVKRDWERTDVEIGCAFGTALTDEEASMLGVPLPPVGDRRRVARTRVEAPSTRTPAPGRRSAPSGTPVDTPAYQAFIYPSAGKEGRPLLTRTRTMSRGMAFLEVERMAGWSFDQMDVSQVVVALDDAYGSKVLLRIVSDGEDLWAGPAEIKDVDVNPDPSGIRLGLSFGRELRAEELDRLGLPTPA